MGHGEVLVYYVPYIKAALGALREQNGRNMAMMDISRADLDEFVGDRKIYDYMVR